VSRRVTSHIIQCLLYSTTTHVAGRPYLGRSGWLTDSYDTKLPCHVAVLVVYPMSATKSVWIRYASWVRHTRRRSITLDKLKWLTTKRLVSFSFNHSQKYFRLRLILLIYFRLWRTTVVCFTLCRHKGLRSANERFDPIDHRGQQWCPKICLFRVVLQYKCVYFLTAMHCKQTVFKLRKISHIVS